MQNLAIIILAAGQSTRMKSQTSKLLHQLCGRPVIDYVISLAQSIPYQKCILVLGHQAEQIKKTVSGERGRTAKGIDFILQKQRLGTGHAVLITEDILKNFTGNILILNGDVPILPKPTIINLIEKHKQQVADITFLTARLSDPSGYGRVLSDKQGLPIRIIEEKDCQKPEKKINEVNSGIYCISGKSLYPLLKELQPNNKQKEYYLTDCIALGLKKGLRIRKLMVDDEREIFGINNRAELAIAYDIIRKRILDRLMIEGVTIIDPKATYIDSTIKIRPDTIIYPYTFIEGDSNLGAHCAIGPFSRIIDAKIGNHVVVKSHCIIDNAVIKDKSIIEPFTRISPGIES